MDSREGASARPNHRLRRQVRLCQGWCIRLKAREGRPGLIRGVFVFGAPSNEVTKIVGTATAAAQLFLPLYDWRGGDRIIDNRARLNG
jgi:hypothetical protein